MQVGCACNTHASVCLRASVQANEWMRAPELQPPLLTMKSWSTGGETVSLDTILRMQEVSHVQQKR